MPRTQSDSGWIVTAQAMYPEYEEFGETVCLAAPEVRERTGCAVTDHDAEAERFPTERAAAEAGVALRTAYGDEARDMAFRTYEIDAAGNTIGGGRTIDGGLIAVIGAAR